MRKTIKFSLLLISAIVLSGCSLPSSTSSNPMVDATFIKSTDDGSTWTPKIQIDNKKTIAGIDVLAMAISPADPNVIYLSTSANGLFETKDGGETWKQVAFANKAYGLVFDPSNPDIMYGSGIFNSRAKIYKRIGEGQEWKEVYTEPSDGTTISSLAIDKVNPKILYAGISNGVIIKSTDGGQTWVNLKMDINLGAPIVSIAFDSASDQHVFFASIGQGVLESRDGGNSVFDITHQIDTVGNTASVYTLVADPYLPGVVYVGTENGIFRRSSDGSWESMNLIESSKAFPIRAIAINPKNSREIIYASSKAIYKSVDGGQKWSTFQLNTSKDISVLKFNPNDPATIFAGLRGF